MRNAGVPVESFEVIVKNDEIGDGNGFVFGMLGVKSHFELFGSAKFCDCGSDSGHVGCV